MNIDDESTIAWAEKVGDLSLSKGWDAYTTFQGEVLTPQNSRVMEMRWLEGIEDLRDRETHYLVREKKMTAKQAHVWFERELCKLDLYYLVKHRLEYDRLAFYLHYPMAQSIADLEQGYRGLRQLPRGWFKTTVFTIGGLAQQVIRDPNQLMALGSNSEDNANGKLTELKGHFFQPNSSLKPLGELFPELMMTRASEYKKQSTFICPGRTVSRREGTIDAMGVQTKTTGRHYGRLWLDDWWDEKDVTSPEIMENCRKSIVRLKFLLPKISDSPKTILFVGTRFAHDDPTTELLAMGYDAVILSGISPEGKSRFPEGASLAEMRREDDEDRYQFSCQVMLNPTSESQTFDKGWFQYKTAAEVEAIEVSGAIKTRTAILVDMPGGGTARGSDPGAAIVVKVDSCEPPNAYIVDIMHGQFGPHEFLELTYQLADKWEATVIFKQKALIEGVMDDHIRTMEQDRRKASKPWRPWSSYSLGKKKKESRMLGLQPLFQKHRVVFDPNIAALKLLESQILGFPHNTKHDDLMDTLSGLTDPQVFMRVSYTPRETPKPEPGPMTAPEVWDQEAEHRRRAAAAAFEAQRGGKKNRGQPGGICR
jgi:phage terminase large subunit-like protein